MSFRFFEQDADNQAFNLLNDHMASYSTGVRQSVVSFLWGERGWPPEQFSAALRRLADAGLIEVAGGYVRLQAAGLSLVSKADVQVEGTQDAQRWGGAKTEYALRNRVLSLFAATNGQSTPKPAAQAQSLERLGQQWQALRQRADDLQNGLGVLMRDRQIKRGIFRSTVFKLTPDGEHYRQGRDADQALEAQAPEFGKDNLACPGANDHALMVFALHCFDGASDRPCSFSEIDYKLERYGMPEWLRFHAFELLFRFGHVDPGAKPGKYTLTPSGQAFLRDIKDSRGVYEAAASVVAPALKREQA